MTMDLAAWNDRLAEHFSALARDREAIPLFALEHGLAPAEVAVLFESVRAHVRASRSVRQHPLAWTVYAAEIGYGYAGDEFWETFEEQTPGWTERDRGWIRDAFVDFRRRFSGAEPSGAWAKRFSIICWPITHAILPRDLQQQLARVLYELRDSFSAELFESPLLLGQFIAARSWSTSARFQNFVQEPALVGQIAAALLLQGEEGSKTLLHPMTLRRIGDDVDRGRRGRDWLRSARRAAEERAKIRGLTLGRATTTPIQRREEARAEIEELGIEPRLVLRPMEGACWEVSLEIPDLSHLLLRFPQVRDVLTGSRCTVAGAAGRPLARGRCLHGGPQRVALKRWPRPDDVLLKFERAEPLLEFLLRAECLLRPGTSWLFKVASDRLAYESRGMRVRAGSRYVLVSTAPLGRSDLARPVTLACEGVQAVSLDLPRALTPEWEEVLRQLRVTQARSIEVWPAGLAAVAWDGEGYGEWLASETPTLAVRSDHAIDELTVAMSGGGPTLSLTLTDTPLGEPIFIELPQLPVGLHKFSFAARDGRGAESKVIGDLDVVMRVREARPWSPGVTSHGPLDVELDPAAPSLDQLWEGKVELLLRGPAGREVKCRVSMFARSGEEPSFDRQLPPVTLPLSSEEWTSHFERHIKKDKDGPRAYDDANVCEVEFSADELGVFALRCEREFTPLRWSVRRDSAGYIARLHDDAGSGVPVIEHLSFERPTVREELPASAEHRAPRGGGLYVATVEDYKAAIVVPPLVNRLEDLKCEPQVDLPHRTPESIARLLSFARIWGDARLTGDVLAGQRRRLVVRALTEQICAGLGGERWGRAERDFRASRQLPRLRAAVRRARGAHRAPPTSIFPDDVLKRLAAAPLHERGVAFATLIDTLPASNARVGGADASGDADRARAPFWLADFTLRVASDPTTICAWAGADVHEGLTRLLDEPILVRAARFLVLAVDQLHHSSGASELYAGWGWPP